MTRVVPPTIVKSCATLAVHNGRSLHDSSKGVGPARSILQGELTENALLNKAATLAAQKHVLLLQPNLQASIVNAKTKPISRELTKLTKQLRQFPGGMGAPGGAVGDDEEREEEEEEE